MGYMKCIFPVLFVLYYFLVYNVLFTGFHIHALEKVLYRTVTGRCLSDASSQPVTLNDF